MTPRNVYTSLCRAVANNRPTLLVGPPGCGKTTIHKNVGRTLNRDVIISTPAVSDPTDYKGLGFPSKDGTHAEFLPFGEMHQLINATRPTLWFIDDIGQASTAVQAAIMPWLLERRCGVHKLSDYVSICAATNGREHKAGVSGILEPVKSRMHKIIHMEPDYSEWREDFAIPCKMPVDIIAYLDWQGHLNNQKFYAFKASTDMKNSPTPRTWANAGDLINDYFDEFGDDDREFQTTDSILFEDVASAIGQETASELWTFRAVRTELPRIEDICLRPDEATIPRNLNALFCVLNTVSARADENNFDSIVRYAIRMNDVHSKELPVQMINDIVLRKPELRNTNTFVKLMTKGVFAQSFTNAGTPVHA